MTTQLFFRVGLGTNDYDTNNNDTNLAGAATNWLQHGLSTTRGASLSAATATTVAGPTAGVEVGGASPYSFISPPVDADVTISGSITWNLWAKESANTANAAINAIIQVIDGATGAFTLIDATARVTELTTTILAVNFAETPAAGVLCKRGDRLRVRVFADDAGTMGSGATVTFDSNAATAAADGDSYFTLTETLSFAAEPAGTQVFLTDDVTTVATASVDREAWTSRGAGVQTDVTNTVAGWTAPIQVTDTAGGTVVDWFTRPLTAFTLGGAVRCNVRGLESTIAANATQKAEVAIVAGDGTSPVVWALGSIPTELTASETAQSFLISGDDTAVTNGQRLRIRLYIDEPASVGPMGASLTITTHYAGTSGGASGDTFLTFTQTLTEFVASADAVRPTALVVGQAIPASTQ